jgi:hypothetical protein
MLDSSRSMFKKRTEQYTKDNVFEIIDIEETLKKNRNIPKVEIDKFHYKSSIIKDKISKTKRDKHYNTNKFGINIDELELIYENNYKIKFIKKYSPIKLIGEGSFGMVIKAIDNKQQNYVAVKIIPKKNVSNEIYLLREMNILSKLNHPNIIKLIQVIDNEDYLYLIMDYLEGLSLKELIIQKYINDKNDYIFKDEECAQIMKSILEGIDYLHSQGIMHRDIKPGK